MRDINWYYSLNKSIEEEIEQEEKSIKYQIERLKDIRNKPKEKGKIGQNEVIKIIENHKNRINKLQELKNRIYKLYYNSKTKTSKLSERIIAEMKNLGPTKAENEDKSISEEIRDEYNRTIMSELKSEEAKKLEGKINKAIKNITKDEQSNVEKQVEDIKKIMEKLGLANANRRAYYGSHEMADKTSTNTKMLESLGKEIIDQISSERKFIYIESNAESEIQKDSPKEARAKDIYHGIVNAQTGFENIGFNDVKNYLEKLKQHYAKKIAKENMQSLKKPTIWDKIKGFFNKKNISKEVIPNLEVENEANKEDISNREAEDETNKENEFRNSMNSGISLQEQYDTVQTFMEQNMKTKESETKSSDEINKQGLASEIEETLR